MDIKAMITGAVEKITSDKKLLENFQKEPEKTVESIIGVDLPDGTVDKVVDAVKAKVSVDKLGDVAGKLKKLF